MGIFRRRGRRGEVDESTESAKRPDAYDAVDEPYDEDELVDEYDEYDDDEYDEDVTGLDGPFDESEEPDDGVARLDLGSVRLPVPDGAQLQVEMDPSGPVRAVHVVTPQGQFTVSAYAAPRSGGLWSEVRSELAEQLNADGAKVHSRVGEWGPELSASLNDVALRFVGVDGPRWLLRGVVAGPPQHADEAVTMLRDIVRGSVVVRGVDPMPVRTPLPIQLPQAIAEHVEQAQAES